MLIDVAISGDRNVIEKEIQRIWNVKSKGDTSSNRGDWDCFKVVQKIREQRTRKA